MMKIIFLMIIVTISLKIMADGLQQDSRYHGWTEEQLANLKDPRTRNEDISNTIVSVKIKQLPDGNYLYNYKVESQENNLGEIMTFALDISCETPNLSDYGYEIASSVSPDGKHLRVSATHQDYQTPKSILVSYRNRATWSLKLNPGMADDRFYMVSQEAPVMRQYKLRPYMDNFGWAYHLYEEDDPSVPWIQDFIVTGTVLGPRCSTDDSPVPDYSWPSDDDNDTNPGDDDDTSPGDGSGGNDDDNDADPGDGNDDGDHARCHPGKGHAYGHEKGKGHSHSQGKHKGHSHDC